MNRPMGVTILAWIAIVGGALEVLFGLLAILASLALLALGTAVAGPEGLFAGIIALVASVISVALGAVGLAFGVGALGLKPWAWSLGVIWCYVAAALEVVNILGARSAGGVISAIIGALIGIAIAAALLYYLFTDEVKAAFGKSGQTPPSFVVPVFAQIDNIVASNKQGPRSPQAPAGYPPAAPGGYAPPPPPAAPSAPQAPASPPAAPGSGFEPPAPPA